ncbi:MAG: hypothetical protein EHM89_02630 [Acidobacteria bacterium]|jgi:hypothetical protein|nr:MAG: hypothetical protein EHM89_02630 [Acidobacteriota bacterium]
MAKRVRDVKDVVEDVYDVLTGLEHEASIEVCLTVLADLLGSVLTSEDLRHIIQEAQDNQGYA